MLAAAILPLVLGLPVRAENPAIPKGPAPVQQASRGFTLNAEVLQRYGYTLDGYNALQSAERQRVSDWIEVLEQDRLRAEARGYGKAAQPPRLKLDEKTQAAMDRIKSGLNVDFDKKKPGSGSWDPGLVPEVELRGPAVVNGEQYSYNNALRRFSLLDPKNDLRLSFGQLGNNGQSPLVDSSPYAGVEKGWHGSGKALDWDAKASAYALNLGARLYYDDQRSLDARLDSGLKDLKTSAPDLGIKPGDVDTLSKSLSYSTDFQRQWMFLGSLMGRVGRAYTLLGSAERGVDLGWSAMGLMRVDQIFPNATLDQTAGVRVRPDAGHNVGIFGGVTEGISLFSQSMVTDSLSGGKLAADVRPVAAPHAEVSTWGKMPYLSGVEYTVSAGRQWNPWTTLTSVSGGLSVDAGKGVKVGAFGNYSHEEGSAIEYERNKSAAGLMVNPNPNLGLSAQYFNQSAAYGDARAQNQGVMLGLTLTETASGGGKLGSVTMESLFGGRDRLLPNESSSQMVQLLQLILNQLKAYKDAAVAFDGGAGHTWSDLQNSWNNLDPGAKQLVGDAYRAAVPSGPSLDRIMATRPATADSLNRLADLLSDTQAMERLLVRYLRRQILDGLAKVEIPILGQKLHMNAPMVLAAAHAYGLGLTPLPPITAKDARESLDGFLIGQFNKGLGCKDGSSPSSATDCLLSQLPKEEADRLRKTYGNDLDAIMKAAVQWPSDVVRREMNQLALQVILASEQLNELTVDKGERIADLNVHALQSSFEYLDRRARADNKRVFAAAKEDLQEDLAAQDAAIRAELSDYGASRLAWLQSQPAWPAGVRVAVRDWPAVLSVYGDAAIFDLILKCKAQLAAKGGSRGLLISLDQPNPLNALSVIPGNPAEIRLPARAVNLSHLDIAL